MSKFNDHLFESLMDEHGAALADTASAEQPFLSLRRFTRPAWATAGALAAATAAVVGFTMSSGSAAAFAVTRNPDGSVTVAVHHESGLSGANAALNKLGAKVVVVQAKAGCESMSKIHSVSAADNDPYATFGASVADNGEITVFGGENIPAGDTAILVFATVDGNVDLTIGMVTDGPVPSCVSLPPIIRMPAGSAGITTVPQTSAPGGAKTTGA